MVGTSGGSIAMIDADVTVSGVPVKERMSR